MIYRNELFEVSSTYWLVVMTLSVCVSVGNLLKLSSRSEKFLERTRRAFSIATAIVLCLTAVDGLNFVQQKLTADYRVFGTVLVIATTAGLMRLHLSQTKLAHLVFRRRLSGWLVILTSIGLSGWSYHRFHERLEPAPQKPLMVVKTPGPKKLIHEFVAVTDRNRPISVYRLSEADPDASDTGDSVIVDIAESTIQRGPPSLDANCHGWVFLDSQFMINGDAVQQILDDNAYELVEEPKPGDVIIYRDDNRRIVHSGLVRGILNDNTVIIESKWGTEGVFLHDPDGTPYTVDYEYYRSPRTDHRVKLVPADEFPMDE